MNGVTVIKSKLIMPQLPSTATMTERLRGLTQAIHDKTVVLVTAPAGYGKTTLIVTALKEYKSMSGRICWYRLDETDRDLSSFYKHLTETLFPEDEKVWEEPRSYLDSCGDIAAQHQYINALFCQELWALENKYPEAKTFIVLDDFHHVWDVPEIFSTVQFFIGNLPPHCALIISSRCDTNLLTLKRRMEGNILEITSGQLCITPDELPLFLKSRTDIAPGEELLDKIMLHTEGWPAGIVLVCQMLGRSSAGEAVSILDRSDRKEMLFQYITAEVLRSVDDNLLRFLVKTAILPEFTAAAAAEIFDEKKALQLLEKCMQKGLFIQKIFGSDTVYRFHSLFREALIAIQPQYLNGEEVKDYHLKAAVFYIKNRAYDRAIEHFIDCGNVDLAVDLVIRAARERVNLLTFETTDQLRLWFKLLPEKVVNNNGYLMYIKSFITFPKRPSDAIQLLERALEIFRQSGDRLMQLHALISMSQIYIERNDIKELKKLRKKAYVLSKGEQGQPIDWMLAVFDYSLTVSEGQFTVSLSQLRSLRTLALTGEWQWLMLLYSAHAYCCLGDLDVAESRIHEAMGLGIVKRTELLTACARLVHSIILQMKGEHEMQSRAVAEMNAVSAKYDYKYLLGFGKRLEAMAAYRRHDIENALELMDASNCYFDEIGNTAMASSNTLYRYLWQSSRDNSRDLLGMAQRTLKELTAEPCGMCLEEIGLSVFGALAREAGDYDTAEGYLTLAVKNSKAKGAKQVLCGACIHLAKLYFDTGCHARGEWYLCEAFDMAARNKYYMFWDLHYPTLVEVAARCVKSGIHIDYIRELIARHYGGGAAGFFENNVMTTPETRLKDFADLFINRQTAKIGSKTFRVSVDLLGRLNIRVNGIAVPDNEWKTKKIAGVFKYLIAHRGQRVSKDRLMEVFWPDADKKSAMMSLRAALYELKKVLRRYGFDAEGLEVFLKERRDTLEVVPGSHLEVDADLFVSKFKKVGLLSPGINSKAQRKAVLEKLNELYRGDFLEEDIYEDWTFAFREEFRTMYFGSAVELAGICMEDGDNVRAEKLLLRLLSIDRYNEEACFTLLKLYCSSNQRARAVRLYKDFARRYEKDLQIKPDERLEAVINGRA